MAGARPLLNFAFYFVVVLATTTVAISRSPKLQVVASRDMSLDIAAIEQKLAPRGVGDVITCLKTCYKQSDCSDGWLCSDCANDAFDQGGKHCDKFTASGQGYFSSMLRQAGGAL